MRHLQQPRQFGIPVRDVAIGSSLLVPQSRDDVAQRQETHVDVDSLLQPLPVRLSLFLSLATSQVHLEHHFSWEIS